MRNKQYQHDCWAHIKKSVIVSFFYTFSIKRLRKLLYFIPEMSENCVSGNGEKGFDDPGIRLNMQSRTQHSLIKT